MDMIEWLLSQGANVREGDSMKPISSQIKEVI
jgi:hypothetical protein